MIRSMTRNLHSIELSERVGDEYFRDQGRIKISHTDDGDIRWYLEDGSEYAIISRRSLEVLHFRRTPAGWLAFDPYISTLGDIHESIR